MSRPKEFSIVGLRDEVYHLLYRNLKVVEVKRIIANFVKSAGFNVSKAYDFVYDWLKKLFIGWGLPEPAEEDLFKSPRPLY